MNKGDIDSAGKFAAILSMTEVGLGSILHAWRVPFSGHFLSLNQGFVSGKAIQSSNSHSPWIVLQVAMIAALLKSLSPVGKRLTPMLAISMQGFLYSVALLIFGSGYIGSMAAIILLSLWAFVQPVLLYLLVFGKSALDVAQYFFTKLQAVVPITDEHLFSAVGFFILVKIVLAALVNHFVFFKRDDECESYFQGIIKSFERVQPKKVPIPNGYWDKTKLVLKDMMRPWFVITMILMVLFFYLSQPEDVQIFWFLLRPLAFGFMVFYALRFLPVDKWLQKSVDRTGSTGSQVFTRAIQYIKETERVL